MIMIEGETRQCKKCGEVKEAYGFGITGNSHRHVCKKCVLARYNERYATDPVFKASIDLAQKEKRARHRGTYAKRNKEYREANKEQHSANRSIKYRERKAAGIVPRYKRVRTEQPGKQAANDTIKHAIKNGTIIRPNKCEQCDKEGHTEAHHHSYLKEDRFDIKWLCIQCHRDYHADHFMHVVLVDVDKIIAPYLVDEYHTKIFTEAVYNFPTLTMPPGLNNTKFAIYEKVFNFMTNLNGNWVYCKYGLLLRDVYGITTIRYVPRLVATPPKERNKNGSKPN